MNRRFLLDIHTRQTQYLLVEVSDQAVCARTLQGQNEEARAPHPKDFAFVREFDRHDNPDNHQGSARARVERTMTREI